MASTKQVQETPANLLRAQKPLTDEEKLENGTEEGERSSYGAVL